MSGESTALKKLYTSLYDCTKCGLHRYRRQVVCGEGDANPHLMLIGEGPGKSENLLGRPFVGPSGRLLRRTIEDATSKVKVPGSLRVYFTNVVACRPTDSKTGPNRSPTKKEAWACMQRLVRIDEIVQPALVILLGAVPARLVAHLFPGAGRMPHPSSILRSGGVESGRYPGYVQDLVGYIQQSIQIMEER